MSIFSKCHRLFTRTQEWLSVNKLRFFVRSHECVPTGCELTKLGSNRRLYTIFSASCYSGGNNFGAVLVFSESAGVGSGFPEIHKYKSSQPVMSLEDLNPTIPTLTLMLALT